MIINSYTAGVSLFFLPFGIVAFFWLVFLSGLKPSPSALRSARLSLMPVGIVLLLIPYSYFYAPLEGMEPWGCLSIVFIGTVIFYAVIKNNVQKTAPLPLVLAVVSVLYVVYFGFLSVLRHLNYQDASSFDVAIYSQIQWNNIHGRFFHDSISGSNFVTHNSPFLILLSPFYAVYPHPATLLVLKTLFLAFGVVPFYLILKTFVNKGSIFPLALGYLFFPFIVGQNFNAPHETCFLTPLLLFSFYFFIKGRFKSFLVFLFLCLSVKEHMALIAVMYGLYAFYLKKEKHWIIAPLVIGVVWGIFSMWIIYHFQKIYNVDPYPAWLIVNIKRRFLRPDHPIWSNLIWGLETSNLGHWCNFSSFYLLLAPLGIILPFFTSIWVLGLPEMAINFLSTVPLDYPTWHYNLVSSVFLLLASAGAVKKLSSYPWLCFRAQLSPDKIQELLSWFLCICILSHFFLWWDFTHIKNHPRYVKTMDAAISMVPQSASVSLTKHLVAYVTDRKDYFLCEDKRKGQYIVLDKNERMGECIPDAGQADHYVLIFRQEGIRVYKLK
ncbi:MAG: DUF2079 domain-containing protein [Candidatus Omnitrophica bacterium]|nr:DUF2079 domain-containing protein [Candidatus Omnitrophota bacterium]